MYANGLSGYSVGSEYSFSGYSQSQLQYSAQVVPYQQAPEYLQTAVEPVALQFQPEGFLMPNRAPVSTVINESEVMGWIREAFRATTGLPYPEDVIELEVADEKRFNELFAISGGKSSEGVMGFAINRFGNGKSRVVVRQAPVDSMLLTLGHEIGHCLSPSLPDMRDEEAKAMSFSVAWMDSIVTNNIAGLSKSINPRPADNGVHNVAWGFVVRMLERGARAIEVFSQLITGSLRISEEPEVHYHG